MAPRVGKPSRSGDNLRDPRVANLAKILVGYSTGVKQDETCLIEGPSAAEALIAAVYDEVLAAGAHPVVSMSFYEQQSTYFAHASDAQLEWISPLSRWAA